MPNRPIRNRQRMHRLVIALPPDIPARRASKGGTDRRSDYVFPLLAPRAFIADIAVGLVRRCGKLNIFQSQAIIART